MDDAIKRLGLPLFQYPEVTETEAWEHLSKEVLEPIQLTKMNLEEVRGTLKHALTCLEIRLSLNGMRDGKQTVGYAHIDALTREIDRLLNGQKSRALEIGAASTPEEASSITGVKRIPAVAAKDKHPELQIMRFEALAAIEMLTSYGLSKKAARHKLVDLAKKDKVTFSASANTVNRWKDLLREEGKINDGNWWEGTQINALFQSVYVDPYEHWVLLKEKHEVPNKLSEKAIGQIAIGLEWNGYQHIEKPKFTLREPLPHYLIQNILLEISIGIIAPMAKRISDAKS